jgi:uncharacterized protein involved in exopolysaccharide biosynthesis
LEKEKQVNYPPYYGEDEIDLYELWLTLKKRKKIVLGITGLFTAIALILCFILPPVYKTETSLMPMGGKGGRGLSSLFASLPVPLSIGGRSGLTVEAVLKSRTLRERIVKDLDLLPELFPDKWDKENKRWILKGENDKPPTILDGANVLKKLISVSTDKRMGVIILSVEFKENPELACKIAETALKETNGILNEKAFTLAKRYRMYVGKQLAVAREKLLEIERIYEEFIKGRIKKVPLIFGKDAFEYGKLKGELIAREKKLEILSQNREISPEDIGKLKEEIKNLRKKLQGLQGRLNYVSLPEYQLNLQKLQSQMSIAQGLFETFVKEYEMAKAQEMKEQISFQVIDPPYIPHGLYKPRKKLIVAVALVSGLFLGTFVAFFKEWLDNVKKRYREGKNNA